MSLEPMVWAMSGDAPVADVNEYAVLGCMAETADRDGCGTWQAKETIAARAHISPETVKRCWRNMLKRGLIAKGDQSLVAHYRADRRPVVYDLLIPYEWFSNIDRVNAERARLGRPPLTPESRPPIAPPPAKRARADKGKPRPKERGNSETPREETPEPTDGGTTSRPRGNYKSSTGELADPQTTPKNQNLGNQQEQTDSRPSVRDVADARDKTTDGRRDGRGGVDSDQGNGTAAPTMPQAPEPVEVTPGVAVLLAIGQERPELLLSGQALRDQGVRVTGMLAEGWTPEQIRQIVAGTPLPSPIRVSVGAIVAGRLRAACSAPAPAAVPTIPAPAPSAPDDWRPPRPTDELPQWCGWCGGGADIDGSPMNPAVLHNGRLRLIEGQPCLSCHPTAYDGAPAASGIGREVFAGAYVDVYGGEAPF